MTRTATPRKVIPLHRPEPSLRRVGDGDMDGPEPILHPASAQVVGKAGGMPAPPMGFWNNVPIRPDEEPAGMRLPLTWQLVKARRNRMRAYLPMIELTTMLLLTLLGVLAEHFALALFGDWK